jgi:hypothetical protein
MNNYAPCLNAKKIQCALRFTCLRFTGKKPQAKTGGITGDYWNGECRLHIYNPSDAEERESIETYRRELFNDLKP